jgi:DNA transformation protein and related proteins
MDDAAIRDMFGSLGEIIIKKMFGGKGVYARGLIIAVEVGGEMMLKADAQSAPLFEAAGSRQWAYEHKSGTKQVKMPYWCLPDEALDDPDMMAKWTQIALDAAMRAKK